MNFHRNDSTGKVTEYCTEAGVHFEYTNFWDKDEENFQNAKNMTNLKKRFKHEIDTVGGKGKAAETQKRQEEEEAKKRQEEANRLVQEAENWLRIEEEEKKQVAQEATKNIEEEKIRKEEDEIRKKQTESEGFRLEGVQKEKHQT